MTDKETVNSGDSKEVIDNMPTDPLATKPSVETTAVPMDKVAAAPAQQNRFKRILNGYWHKKLWTVPLTILLLVGIILLLPVTRYQVLGLFLKKTFAIQVLDETSKKPVTKAQVQLGDAVAQTDAQGKVTLKVPVGKTALEVTKKYYKTSSQSVLIPLKQKNTPFAVTVQATGRQVPVAVTNKISGKPVVGALIVAGDSEAKTDKDGKAIVVVPADKKSVAVKIAADGMNTTTGTLKVTEQSVPENSFKLVSAGKVYFLSKLSGKIDVVKTNLDGTDRQTVLAGTGKEITTDTILLASRDWKYLALKSQRDGGTNSKLFLIDTSNDKAITMDEGNADFQAIGWSDHRFVYQVLRNGLQAWQPKRQALKSFDATTAKLTTIDETDGEGTGQSDYAYTEFSSVYIVNNELVYNKNWNANYTYFGPSRLAGKQISLVSVKPDGTGRKTLKDFPIPDGQNGYYSIDSRLYEAQGLYIRVAATDPNAKANFYELEAGKVVAKTDVTDQDFYNTPYPTYLASPSGKQTFWAEERDGKSTLFVGDDNGKNGKQVASLSEYTTYGWFTDDYLLVSKNSSELYIMPVAGGAPIKVTDYHKPDFNFRGYGGGYGGL